MYYKLGQTCLANWDSLVLLQIRVNVVTNWGSFIITNRGSFIITNCGKCCYKFGQLGQPLLQNRVAIANWGKMYYKLGQVLQIRAIITNWSIVMLSPIIIKAYRNLNEGLYFNLIVSMH